MLALEDIARMQNHSYSAQCITPTGTVLMMEVDKFHGVIKHIPNGFSAITQINKTSWKKFVDKLTQLEEQKKELKGPPRNEIFKDSGERFTNMEFFKSNFFEKRLDSDKMARIFQQKDISALKKRIAQRFQSKDNNKRKVT